MKYNYGTVETTKANVSEVCDGKDDDFPEYADIRIHIFKGRMQLFIRS